MLCLRSFWVWQELSSSESSRLDFAEERGRICGGNRNSISVLCYDFMIMGA